MAINVKYENFSFFGSREDLFTRYKRKCATAKRKKTRFIPMAVVLVCLVGLIIGLSVGLHVSKTSQSEEPTEKIIVDEDVSITGHNETLALNVSVSIEQNSVDTAEHIVMTEQNQQSQTHLQKLEASWENR